MIAGFMQSLEEEASYDFYSRFNYDVSLLTLPLYLEAFRDRNIQLSRCTSEITTLQPLLQEDDKNRHEGSRRVVLG